MKERHFLLDFVIRGIIGITMIYFLNVFLEERGISIRAGINAVNFILSGILGVPGVGLIYGILFYSML